MFLAVKETRVCILGIWPFRNAQKKDSQSRQRLGHMLYQMRSHISGIAPSVSVFGSLYFASSIVLEEGLKVFLKIF
jgi:hypothetical protein